MKKRSFYAILLVAIGLFILSSYALSASNYFSSQSSIEGVGGGNSTSTVNGVYVPD